MFWLSTLTEGYQQQTQKAKKFTAISAAPHCSHVNCDCAQLIVSLEVKVITLTPSLGRGQRCFLIMKIKQSWVMLQELIHDMVQALRRREMWEGLCFTSYSSSIQMIQRDSVISCHCEPCGWTSLHVTGQIQTWFMRMKLIQDKQRCFWLKSVWIESQLFRNHRNFDGNKGRWLPCKGNLHLFYHLLKGRAGFPTALNFSQSLTGLQNCILVWQDTLNKSNMPWFTCLYLLIYLISLWIQYLNMLGKGGMSWSLLDCEVEGERPFVSSRMAGQRLLT